VLIAVDEPHGAQLATELDAEGISIVAVVAAGALARAAATGADTVGAVLADADTVVLETSRATLDADVVAACDRRAVRIVPLAEGTGAERLAQAFGLEAPLALAVEGWQLAERIAAPPVARPAQPPSVPESAGSAPRVITVWGPAGSPGRTTLAIELAVELARGGRRVGLVDADSHAPSIALALGLADEAPGFAAACRQSELGGLDARELARISAPIGGSGVDVLTGLNRPSRWPELSEARVAAALTACRAWADYTVVDVAAPLERDEEIVSDLNGPRRNAATLAALRSADLVVAVTAADPLGISRFLRAYPELRSAIGATPVAVLANRLRPGALGIDARGQVRRTLDRFGGVGDVRFVPTDARSADAAMLAARPIAAASPRSPIALAVRRFVGEVVEPPAQPSRRIRSSRARDRRPVPA
jgi:MinD-like ATPase involved in chromosome partitioning or flagellar assembly